MVRLAVFHEIRRLLRHTRDGGGGSRAQLLVWKKDGGRDGRVKVVGHRRLSATEHLYHDVLEEPVPEFLFGERHLAGVRQHGDVGDEILVALIERDPGFEPEIPVVRVLTRPVVRFGKVGPKHGLVHRPGSRHGHAVRDLALFELAQLPLLGQLDLEGTALDVLPPEKTGKAEYGYVGRFYQVGDLACHQVALEVVLGRSGNANCARCDHVGARAV